MTVAMDRPVAIIDDDDALLDAMAVMFDAAELATESFASAEAFLEALDAGGRYGCAVIDVRLPGMDGMALFRLLQSRGAMIPAVILTGHGDVPMAVEALKAGAVDFIEKPFDPDRLLEGVRQAFGRGELRRRDQMAIEELNALVERLTPREREVMDLMVVGHSNKAIASKLGISPRTVEIHRARVMEKMSARTLAELVRMTLPLNP